MSITERLKELIPNKGRNISDVAGKLGISSQRLGQYMSGRMKPKIDFYKKWKEVFGEDLQNETNVSTPMTTEERLILSQEKQIDFLMRLTETSLVTILEAVLKTKDTSLLNRAYLEAGLHHQALLAAEGDEEKKVVNLDTINRLVAAHYKEDLEEGKPALIGKR